MKKALDEKAQSMLETALAFPIILVMVLAILQLAIIITCQLTLNFAVFKASRAVLVSSNTSTHSGFGNNNSVYQDVNETITSTLTPVVGTGWISPIGGSVKIFWHNGKDPYGVSRAKRVVGNSTTFFPNRTIWVYAEYKVIISMPFMRYIMGDTTIAGLPWLNLPYHTIKATCLVDTPSQVNPPKKNSSGDDDGGGD